MPALILNSYAKLNLYLAVLNKRKDNYHNLETLFERISLCDRITLRLRSDKRIKITGIPPVIPQDSSNLAYKSAELLIKSLDLDKGVDIKIIKRIPVGSGMGGGSSNAAAVLTGLNRLLKLRLSRLRLVEFAKKIGADVPFFIYDTAFALGRSRGDEIKPLCRLNKLKLWHILVVPKIKVSTPLIYEKWDEKKKAALTIPELNVKLLLLAFKGRKRSLINKTMFNSLEEITAEVYPEVKYIRSELLRLGADSILMSGSGPTVFAVVSSKEEAVSLSKQLKQNRFWQVFVTRTV